MKFETLLEGIIFSGRITSSDIVCGKSFTYVAFCVTTEALDRIAGKRAKSTTAPTTLKIQKKIIGFKEFKMRHVIKCKKCNEQ